MDSDVLRQLLALLLVFGLLGVAAWKLRRRDVVARGSGPRLASRARLALSPQHAVHLLELDGREWLVATHPQGCTVMHATGSGDSRKAAV